MLNILRVQRDLAVYYVCDYVLRKPQTAKTKNGIHDWHLMVFVSVLVLVDVIILTFYTLLEGLVDNFGVLRVPSKENPSSVTGVRWIN